MNFKAFINPLAFTAVDFGDVPTPKEALKFICPPGIPSEVKRVVQRYRAIGPVPPQLAVAPVEQEILQRILLPLRQAKASYITGNYLSVIALCGIVAEMVAILLWELDGPKLGELREEDKTKLFRGKTISTKEDLRQEFERSGQKYRVTLLSKLCQRVVDAGTNLDSSFFGDVKSNIRKLTKAI